MSNGFSSADHQGKQFHDTNEHTDSTPAALLEQLIYVDSFMPDVDPSSFDNQLTAELAAFADDSFIFPDEEKPKNNGPDNNDLNPNRNINNNSINNNFNDNRHNNNDNHIDNDVHFIDGSALNLHQNDHNDPHKVYANNDFTEGHSSNQPFLNHVSEHVNKDNNNSNTQPSQINPDLLSQSLVTILSSQGSTHNSIIDSLSTSLLSNVPKVYVPPGALSTLTSAGLSQIQIDALAALIAQHQSREAEGSRNVPSGNENVGFHDSAVSALNGYTSNANVINNFTPIQHSNEHHAPLSDIVSILNANSPRPNQQLQSEIKYEDQFSANSEQTRFESMVKNQAQQQLAKSSPQSTIIPSPSSTTTSPAGTVKMQPNTPFIPSPSNGSSDAADSDKRRRNTAASARFRIKKKLKEQEMERSIRDLNENSQKLKMRIQQLEMENRLLRNLVVEKGAQRNNDELEKLKQRAREGV